MTVHLVISLPKMPYIHRVYMVLANPNYMTYNKLYTQNVAILNIPCKTYRQSAIHGSTNLVGDGVQDCV